MPVALVAAVGHLRRHSVYPAAGLIDYFRGEHLVVINKSPTPRDRYADLLIQEPIGQVFAQIQC